MPLNLLNQAMSPYGTFSHFTVTDDFGSRKAKAIRNAVYNSGARLRFLPPYPPKHNPTGQAFAKGEHWMRIAYETVN